MLPLCLAPQHVLGSGVTSISKDQMQERTRGMDAKRVVEKERPKKASHILAENDDDMISL